MTLKFYMAHPYQGKPENLVRARAWLKWLNEAVDDAVFVAPWIEECEKGQETPESRADGLRRMRDFIATECDGVLAIGRLTDGVLSELLSHRERWFYGFKEPPESWAEFIKYSRKIPSEVYEWNIVPVIFQ